MSVFPRISTTSIGQNKNAPRVWIEGRYLLKAGFVPAKNIQVEFAKQEIRMTLAQDGPRRVSSKKNGDIPVLDLNSSTISDSFGEMQLLQVRITEGEIILTPAYSEQLLVYSLQKRQRRKRLLWRRPANRSCWTCR